MVAICNFGFYVLYVASLATHIEEHVKYWTFYYAGVA